MFGKRRDPFPDERLDAVCDGIDGIDEVDVSKRAFRDRHVAEPRGLVECDHLSRGIAPLPERTHSYLPNAYHLPE
jgi:hypothetical protein